MGYLNEDGLATLVGKVKGQVVQLTQAEYQQLPDTKNSDNKLYFVEDEEFSWKIDDEPTLNSDGLAKSGGIYTYTSKIGSGTLTTTAQTIIPAINELNLGLTNLNTTIDPLLATNRSWQGNVNVDNYKTTGLYPISSGATNAPAGWGILLVLGIRYDTIVQLYFGGTKMYYRECRNSSWNEWKTVVQ